MADSQTHAFQTIAEAISFLAANFQRQPSLAEAARHVHLSEFHFQRMFTEWAGVSPKKFTQFLSLGHAKEQLRRALPLDRVAHETGLSGTSRLHDLFVKIEGMTPGEFKLGGAGRTIRWGLFESRFGPCLLAAVDGKICRLDFPERPAEAEAILHRDWPNARFENATDSLSTIYEKVFSPKPTMPDELRLLLRGTPFQLKVWEALLRIPEGRLVSYDQVAAEIGQPGASRAVGTAIGQNPVGYLIPCHRVIKKTGAFGEYRWSAARKAAIIGWEAARSEAA